MPTGASQGMAGLLADAGVNSGGPSKAPATPTPAIPTEATGGMASLLKSASTGGGTSGKSGGGTAPIQSPGPSPFSAPLFGGKSNVNPAQPFETPSSKILSQGDKALNSAFPDVLPAIAQPFKTSQSFNPTDWLNAGADQLGSTIQDAGSKLADAVSTIQDQHASALDKGVAVGEAGVGTLNALFSIITTPLTVISKVPGVGYAADLVNSIFGAVGAGGQDAAQDALAKAPISDTAKAKLKPLVGQLGSLATQLLVGKAGTEIIPDIADKSQEVAQAVADTAKEPATQEIVRNQVQDTLTKPPETAPDQIFTNSASVPKLKDTINTTKATDMHPVLRQEIRDSLQKNGPAATHSALVGELGAGSRQAESFIREAPTPQNAAEELQAHQNAMRTAFQGSPAKEGVIQMGAKPKDTSGLPSLDINKMEAPKSLISPDTRYNALPKEAKATVLSRARSLSGKGMDWADAKEQALNEYEGSKTGEPWKVVKEPNIQISKDVPPEPKEAPSDTAKIVADTKKNGGITIDKNGTIPLEGYSYSPYKGRETIIPAGKFDAAAVDAFKAKNADLLSQPGNHLGIWRDGDNYYLDVSKVGPPTADTLKEAQNNEQLAVYDLAKGESITTGQITDGKYTASDVSGIRSADRSPGEALDSNRTGSERGGGQTPESSGKGNQGLETEPGVSKVGKSIEAKAIEANLTKGYGEDTARYNPTTFEEQAQKVSDLINSGINNARAVVRGEAPIPEGMREFSFISGMEEYAKTHPQEAPDILGELANSKLASATSEQAQGLALGRMREPDSATARLQEIRKSLEDAAGGKEKVAKAKASLVSGAKKAMETINLSKEELSWDKFLNSITC
jgi:hypothetical protein